MFWDRLSIQPTWIVFFFQMSVGSDSDLNENDKDPYQQSVQENEIYICEETLKGVDNILNEYLILDEYLMNLDVPEFNFPVDTSHFDVDPNPINQSIFSADTSVPPDLNPNPINQSIFLAGISAQPDLNPNLVNQGSAHVSNGNSIGTPSNNLPLRESTNVLENGPKKKRARTQVEKSERNAKKYPVLQPCKESCSKRCITNFSSDDRALINSRFWKLSFTERRQWLAAYINQVDVKNKTSQQKDGGHLPSREYLLHLKGSNNLIVCKSMLLNTRGLKSDGTKTEMVLAQSQSCDGAIAPIEDRRGSHPPSNKCDAEVIYFYKNSCNPAISHYKRKNAAYKRYLNPELSTKEMYKNFSDSKENNKTYCNAFKSENVGFS